MLKKLSFKINGMHCQSCKVLLETEIGALAGVKKFTVNYKNGGAEIEYDDSALSAADIFGAIKGLNYSPASADPGADAQTSGRSFAAKRLLIAGGALAGFFILYYAIQAAGLLEVMATLNERNIGFGLIFLIGLLSGAHCVGMCGGLVVSYSAGRLKTAPSKSSVRPHLAYNAGRLVSYTIIGGILGGFGSFFAINPDFTGFILILAAVFMVVLGLSLLTENRLLAKFKLKTPEFVARFLYRNKHSDKPRGPFVIGLLNGFMPCGPLQAMQIYALSTGSIVGGALSLGIYALGTVPLLFGFGQVISYLGQSRIRQVMKISGAVVIVLGLFMFNRGLVNFGLGASALLPGNKPVPAVDNPADNGSIQEVRMKVAFTGYQPNVIHIKKDVPVRWIIDGSGITGCTNEIILHGGYNIRKKLSKGETVIEFTSREAGEIKFSCWMQMVWGKFVVSD